MIVDYHMHLRAPDGSIEHTVDAVERFVERAAERGIDEIGFTEHVYYFERTRALWSMRRVGGRRPAGRRADRLEGARDDSADDPMLSFKRCGRPRRALEGLRGRHRRADR